MTYTVTITDPDAPSRDDPKWSEFCHWIATGVTLSDDSTSSCDSLALKLSSLSEVMEYYPPGPPEKTGKHRYVFLVFAPANGTTEPLDLTKPEDRKHWGYDYDGERVGVRRWSQENGLVAVGELFPNLISASELSSCRDPTPGQMPVKFNADTNRTDYMLTNYEAANFIYAKNKKQ